MFSPLFFLGGECTDAPPATWTSWVCVVGRHVWTSAEFFYFFRARRPFNSRLEKKNFRFGARKPRGERSLLWQMGHFSKRLPTALSDFSSFCGTFCPKSKGYFELFFIFEKGWGEALGGCWKKSGTNFSLSCRDQFFIVEVQQLENEEVGKLNSVTLTEVFFWEKRGRGREGRR